MRLNLRARHVVAAGLLAASLSSCWWEDDSNPTAVSFAAGVLDDSFGTGGKVSIPFTDGIPAGFGIGLHPDQKILVVGPASNGSNYDIGIARFHTNGSLDTTFGTAGKTLTPIGTADDQANALAFQSDGKIVVAGKSTNASNNTDFAVVRYTPGGAVDFSVTTAIGTGDDDGNAVALQSDGKIVVAGVTTGVTRDFALVRYNTGGTVDFSVTTPIGTADDTANGVAIQSDGKILAAGYSFDGSNKNFALVRYATGGTVDFSVTTPIGTGEDEGTAIALQSDGKILVAGFSNNGSNNDFAVVRYNSDGSLDASFGSGGKVTTQVGNGDEQANALTLQSDGKIVVAGESSNGSNVDFAVVRYNADGSLDTTFGTGGKIVTPITTNGNDKARAVLIQSDGRIVVSGYSDVGPDNYLAMARYK